MATATLIRTDEELQKDVLAELKWNAQVQPNEIGVSVKDGVVTLTGWVDSYLKSWSAEEAAHKVAGVKAVANDIEVKLATERTDPDIAEAAVHALHHRDAKFCTSFRQLVETDGRKAIALPARSPNLNAYAERWVRSAKEECLSKLILFGEGSLRRTLHHYVAHYHEERNHQGRQNQLLFPRHRRRVGTEEGAIRCRERLGGLLKYYDREAASGPVGAGNQAMNS